jgi:hypothetical protein
MEAHFFGDWFPAVVIDVSESDPHPGDRLTADGRGYEARTILVPICERRAFFAVEILFKTRRAESALTEWLQRARLATAPPAACAELGQ